MEVRRLSAQAIVRHAAVEDADAIGRVRVAAWQAAYRGHMPGDYLGSLDPRANLDDLRAILKSREPPFLVRVAELGGEVAAFSILGRPRYAAGADTLELWALNVAPRYWRRGIAWALVGQSLDDARSSGALTLELWCIPTNRAARALYESRGFNRTGQHRTTAALTGHPLDEIAYRAAL
ncbi:MAG: GNAT family N-acetyltransferase [Sterolibacteriaceae bacterium]|nr:GNAT family N-acetyltransferase [Candidatus Methylophosphatis haderslevensis]